MARIVILDPLDTTVEGFSEVNVQALDNNGLQVQDDLSITLVTDGSSIVPANPTVSIVDGSGTVVIIDRVAETASLSLSDITGIDTTSTQDVVFSPGAEPHARHLLYSLHYRCSK